jgi:hypothetical protein
MPAAGLANGTRRPIALFARDSCGNQRLFDSTPHAPVRLHVGGPDTRQGARGRLGLCGQYMQDCGAGAGNNLTKNHFPHAEKQGAMHNAT